MGFSTLESAIVMWAVLKIRSPSKQSKWEGMIWIQVKVV